MAGRKGERRVRSKSQIPRILPLDASVIFERCERVLEASRELLANLRSVGIAELFARLDDSVLELAIQPDSWGERTRARLMSDLAPALCPESRRSSVLSVEDIVRVTNVVMPCLLLELGRRKQHIRVEFPRNPVEPNAGFRVSLGLSNPTLFITTDRLLRLVNDVGEALVGLCYFGDEERRERIEAGLTASH